MNLKEFNPKNSVSLRGQAKNSAKRPMISINTKTGLIRINRNARILMDLTTNDQIKILQDEEEPDNWYIEKVTTGGFELKENAKQSPGGLVMYNTIVTRSIAESVAFADQSGRLLLAGQPTEVGKGKDRKVLYGLLTITLRNK